MNNMKKMKFYLVSAFVFAFISGMAQSNGLIQRVERINDTLYLVQNEEKFRVDTEVITVKLKPSEKELGSNYKVINSNRLGFIDIKVPEGTDVERYVNDLKQTGKFETVEFIGEAKCCFTPNDIYNINQWHINSIHLNEAWNITTGNPNIKVAIIDTGVDASHSDLGYTVNDGYSQIDTSNGVNYTSEPNAHINPLNFHGTFVAGILGAKTNNTIGVSGISGGNHSKGITIIPYCVGNTFSFSGRSIDEAILDAIDKGV
jgi:thermitase